MQIKSGRERGTQDERTFLHEGHPKQKNNPPPPARAEAHDQRKVKRVHEEQKRRKFSGEEIGKERGLDTPYQRKLGSRIRTHEKERNQAATKQKGKARA